MFGTLFDKVTGLFDKRFVLGLLLPVFAFVAGVGALVATDRGWTPVGSWWRALDGTRQLAIGLASAVGIVFIAIVLGTQVVAITRLFEGYWGPLPVDATLGKLGRRWQNRRRTRLAGRTSDRDYLRFYLGYAPTGEVLPTRLGNVLRAAESYPGDDQRWQLDAVFWWPRLYLLLPDSARAQIDETRATLDQMVVLSMLLAAYVPVAVGFGFAGMRPAVWAWCAVGALVVSRLTYLTAVSAAAAFGELVRCGFDLFRTDLLKHLGWPIPETLANERALWLALGQQLYRRGTSNELQAVLEGPRPAPAPDAPAA